MNPLRLKALVLTLALAICYEQPYADDKAWVYDEVLTKLHEIGGDIRAIRRELVETKRAVQALQSERNSAVNIPSEVKLSGIPVLGSDSAEYAIVEISDFQCPYCKRHYANAFGKLNDNYIATGKIRYAVLDYPLPFHEHAESAAVAARCASGQGKYWEVHGELFGGNDGILGRSQYLEIAKKINLDIQEYESCLDNEEIKHQVQASAKYSESLGVRGTPAFFMGKISDGKITNVKAFAGAQPYDRFVQVIDAMMKEN